MGRMGMKKEGHGIRARRECGNQGDDLAKIRDTAVGHLGKQAGMRRSRSQWGPHLSFPDN